MKRFLAVFCALALLICAVPMTLSAGAAGASTDFAVLSTTDMHGRCWDTNVLTDGAVSNSMLNVSTAVSGIRETYGADNVLLVDNGDLYQGTPVSSYQLSLSAQGQNSDPAAMALCLSQIGYTAAGLGNHEFNYGWDTMNAARAYLAEHGVSTVCANLYDATTGDNLFTPYLVKEIAVGDKTLKVGILGLENTDCTRWDVSSNYPNAVFAHPDNTQKSMAWEVQRYLPKMQADGCELIIVAYHSGLGSTTGALQFGVNTENQIARMIAETTGVDMVIAGHDHSTSYSNTYLKNASDKDVLVVNGGGTQLTQSVFTATAQADGSISVAIKSTQNLNLSNYAADAALKALIAPYAALANTYVNQSAGTATGTWDTITNFYLKQSDTIDLINRAQIAMGSKHIAEKYNTPEKINALYSETGLDHLDIDLSSTSVVVSGNYTVSAGDISMKDIYKMYRYDNTLYVLALTGQEIKDILEYNATNHLKATVKNGAVTYTTKGEDFTNPVFGGLNFTYDMALAEGSRVVISGFDNGRAFDLNKTYLVGVNNYHLGNTGCGFGIYGTDDSVWSQNDDLGGGVVQDLIYEFIQDETTKNGSVTPKKSNWSLSYSGSLEGGGTLTGDLFGKQVSQVNDGDQILIFYDADSTVISKNAMSGGAKLDAVDAVIVGDTLGTSKTNAAVFTVGIADAANNYLTFQNASGEYLTAGDTGNSLGFNATLTDCGKWYLTAVTDGFHIMNVGAAYADTHNQALEWYTGFTTYGVKDTSAYLFNLYKVTDETPPEPTEPVTEPTEPVTEPTEPVTEPTEPVTEPTEPVTEPTEPVTEPTEPVECPHNWGTGVLTTAPTCTTPGVLTFTCTLCGASKTEVYPASGHIDANNDDICDICGQTISQPQYNPFVDVKKGYYYKAVLWAVENDITQGTDMTHFSPDKICTRGEVVTFLWRVMGAPKPVEQYCEFDDVNAGSYYYEAVLWAEENDITNGVDLTHFAPNKTVTRAQCVTFLWRALSMEKPANKDCPFKDVRTGAYYYNAVLWATQLCITDGIDATHFAPNASCQRSHIVTFLWRAFNK